MWHPHEFSDFEKEALQRMGQGLEQWQARLYKQPRETRLQGVKKMVQQTYNIQDARKCKEPTLASFLCASITCVYCDDVVD